eukprot:1155866-Pelagomonas_calceolata.AAC.5
MGHECSPSKRTGAKAKAAALQLPYVHLMTLRVRASGYDLGCAYDTMRGLLKTTSTQKFRHTHTHTHTLGRLSSIPVIESQAKADLVAFEVLQNCGRPCETK